jgi:hypothetical protein
MKWTRFVILLFASCSFSLSSPIFSEAQEKGQEKRVDPALQQARQMADQLAEKIRGILFQELEKGSFPGAVRACSEVAQEITRQFNTQPGHFVRRVSLKNRNPLNVPDGYEWKKLEEFDRLQREKKLAKEFFEIQKEGGGEVLRYLKPLVALPLCITCHGPSEKIPDPVKTILKEKYPDDKATGYQPGDVRGAISVKINLP